jgi:GntR family transcriptional regulator/MocR family aminotransferase
MPAALPPAMPEILPVVTLDRQSRVPLYRQIYRGYRDAIAERRLRPGERLPSTRSLAAELGVSRLPVLAAFDQLLAEGYCESRLGAGTFVAEALGAEGAVAPGAPPPRPGRRRTSRASARFAVPRDEPWLAGTGAFRTSQVDMTGFPVRRLGASGGAPCAQSRDRACSPTATRWVTCPSASSSRPTCAPPAACAARPSRSWW